MNEKKSTSLFLSWKSAHVFQDDLFTLKKRNETEQLFKVIKQFYWDNIDRLAK